MIVEWDAPARRIGILSSACRRRRGTLVVLAAAAAALVITGLMTAPQAAMADSPSSTPNVIQYVDPFVSTQGDHGNDLPGAEAPNSLAKVNPMTYPGRDHSGYDYAQSEIEGFTNTNVDGTGGSGAGGDILVVPTSVGYTARPPVASYAHSFSHGDETATPGYYQVGLGETTGTDSDVQSAGGTINAEMTATTRTAWHRYSFPSGQNASLVFDLDNNFTDRVASSVDVGTTSDGNAALSGQVTGQFNGPSYRLYYYATTNIPATGVQTWGDNGTLSNATSQDGVDTGAIMSFDPSQGSDVELRITLSPVSVAQAKIDQQNEIGGSTFDQTKEATADEWNGLLGRVQVTDSESTDPDGSLEKLFYTHLYRMMAEPVNATSTSGTYRGVDGVIHRADGYTHYDGWSTWDNFREFGILASLYPDKYRDMVQSLIDLFADTQNAGETDLPSNLLQSVPTVRFERSAIVIADAISKGFTGFQGLAQAYPALQRQVGADGGLGYLPGDPGDSIMRGYDDYGMSIIAEALGKTQDASKYRSEAEYPFETQFKPDAWTAGDGTPVGVLTAKNAGGTFENDNYEQFQAADLYQGTLWQYNWYDTADMASLTNAMGGTHATQLALAHTFGEDDPTEEQNGEGMLHSNANEVELQTPYLFNYVGEPSETQKWVRKLYTQPTWNRYIATNGTDSGGEPSGNGEFTPPIDTKVYKLAPEGFLSTMDNDLGTMSATFVSAALGMDPVTLGTAQYQIGSPFFNKVAITYPNGRTFTINANGVSSSNYYIQSATQNGTALGNTWIDYNSMINGGSLDFQMGPTASDWGANGAPAYSMSTSDDPGSAPTEYSVSADTSTVPAAADGSVSGKVTLTLKGGASFSGADGDELVSAGDATVIGLPGGVSATVVRTSDTTVEVDLHGQLSTSASFYVNFADGAFGGGVTADEVEGQGISLQQPIQISVSALDAKSLQSLVERAQLVPAGNYLPSSYAALQSAITAAQTTLGNPEAQDSDITGAQEKLQGAIEGLTLENTGFTTLQAEKSEAWSGGQLSNEAYMSDGDLGGVTNGAWVQYSNLQVAGSAPTSLAIRYATDYPSTTAPNSVTAHAGGPTGPVIGTAQLNGSTGSWADYATVTIPLSNTAALLQEKAVTFVFNLTNGGPWVGNFDWFRFGAPNATDTDLEAESYTSTNAGDGTPGDAAGHEPASWNDGTTVTTLNNTHNDDWLEYEGVSFAGTASEVSVHYVNNSSRCGTGSAIEVYLDSYDAADPGTPWETIPLPVTGGDWFTPGTSTVALPTGGISGTHTVYLRLVTTPDGNHPYVANIDNLTFSAPGDNSELQAEVNQYEPLASEASEYDSIDFGVFQAQLTAAQNMLQDSTATATELAQQEVDLQLAAQQLVPLPRLELQQAVHAAQHLDTSDDTDASVAAFNAALDSAQSKLAESGASDSDMASALSALQQAEGQLVAKVHTVPSSPSVVSVSVSGHSAVVDWTAPSDDGDEPITGFEVELDDGTTLAVNDPTALTATVTGLTPGKAYRARVIAKNALGSSAPSDYSTAFTIAADVPAQIQDVTATGGVGSLSVIWSPPDDGGASITGYIVTLDGTTSADAPATAGSYTFTNVTPGPHSVTVVATNSSGRSAPSAAASAVVQAATGTGSTSGNSGPAANPGTSTTPTKAKKSTTAAGKPKQTRAPARLRLQSRAGRELIVDVSAEGTQRLSGLVTVKIAGGPRTYQLKLHDGVASMRVPGKADKASVTVTFGGARYVASRNLTVIVPAAQMHAQVTLRPAAR
jgi:predicted alpha-1,2-mannosidase